MSQSKILMIILIPLFFLYACSTGGDVVQVTTVSDEKLKGLGEEALAQLAEIKESKKEKSGDNHLKNLIKETQNYGISEYLALYPDANNPLEQNYCVGGYDIIDIIVYEEEDLSREKMPISADGHISFPLIGRLKIGGLTTSEIENLISTKLAQGQFLLDAHVSVSVREYKSKQFLVLGSVNQPGSYPLEVRERVLDAISRAEGIDDRRGGNRAVIIRTLNQNTLNEKKIGIRIDLPELLSGEDQLSNLLLFDKDVIYVPKSEFFYIIGQVAKPGSYAYLKKRITIVEAISQAGGFTKIAARNRTRIIRLEENVEKIIQVKVDAITQSGKKGNDIVILPGDVIVVPESFF